MIPFAYLGTIMLNCRLLIQYGSLTLCHNRQILDDLKDSLFCNKDNLIQFIANAHSVCFMEGQQVECLMKMSRSGELGKAMMEVCNIHTFLYFSRENRVYCCVDMIAYCTNWVTRMYVVVCPFLHTYRV